MYGKSEDKELEKLINEQLKKFEELKTLLVKAQILSISDPATAKALMASIKEMVASLIASMSSILNNTNLPVKVERILKMF